VPLDALALALAAAVVHAAWNVALAGARQTRAATAVAGLAGAVVFAPLAAATWELDAAALPYLAGSILAELAYLSLLARAYERAELSVVYPISRGAAPVLVLGGSAIALADRPGALQIAGVVLVAAGVIAVRGVRSAGGTNELLLALAIAVTIATYTVIDKRGLDHAAPLAYVEVELLGASVLYALLLAARGGGPDLRAAVSRRALVTGTGMYGGYALTLAALQLAPAAAVAAVRETSVVFGVALAWATLGERVTAERAAGAIAVVAGVALLAA
jgi:drug/metabolite transporter (DMT)-like permease